MMRAAEELWFRRREASLLARLRLVRAPQALAPLGIPVLGLGIEAFRARVVADIAATFSPDLALPWDNAP